MYSNRWRLSMDTRTQTLSKRCEMSDGITDATRTDQQTLEDAGKAKVPVRIPAITTKNLAWIQEDEKLKSMRQKDRDKGWT